MFKRSFCALWVLAASLCVPSAWAQVPAPTVRSQLYTVVDEQCRADRMRECVAGSTYSTRLHFSAGTPAKVCLDGFDQSAPTTLMVDNQPHREWTCTVPSSNVISLKTLADSPDPVGARVQRCAALSQSAIAMAAPQCLRNVDMQRLVDTLESDIRLLLRELCQANQSKDCDIKFPAALAAVVPK